MSYHINASSTNKPGAIVPTVGNTRHLIVIEEVGPQFRANSEDADVWGLDRGYYYQRAEGRDPTFEERNAYEFGQNPNSALYSLIMRSGQKSDVVGDTLTTLSHNVHSGVMTLRASGDQIIARSHTHIYDGDDIISTKTMALSDLPADYAAHARALIQRAAEAAAQADEEEWETL